MPPGLRPKLGPLQRAWAPQAEEDPGVEDWEADGRELAVHSDFDVEEGGLPLEMQYHHIVLDEAVEELSAPVPGAGAHYDGAKAKLSMVKFVGAVSESPIWGGKLGEALPHTE